MLASATDPRSLRYQMRLYVGGNGSRSSQAIRLVKDVCEERLRANYFLEVIDLHQQAVLAARDRIVAVPTLLRQHPFPSRRIVGNLTRDRVLAGLDLT
jgi:circadian clock protein KaiB